MNVNKHGVLIQETTNNVGNHFYHHITLGFLHQVSMILWNGKSARPYELNIKNIVITLLHHYFETFTMQRGNNFKCYKKHYFCKVREFALEFK